MSGHSAAVVSAVSSPRHTIQHNTTHTPARPPPHPPTPIPRFAVADAWAALSEGARERFREQAAFLSAREHLAELEARIDAVTSGAVLGSRKKRALALPPRMEVADGHVNDEGLPPAARAARKRARWATLGRQKGAPAAPHVAQGGSRRGAQSLAPGQPQCPQPTRRDGFKDGF